MGAGDHGPAAPAPLVTSRPSASRADEAHGKCKAQVIVDLSYDHTRVKETQGVP